MKALAVTLSLLGLAACLALPILHLTGALPMDRTHAGLLAATALWWTTAPWWLGRGNNG